jgi:hypothetical protein
VCQSDVNFFSGSWKRLKAMVTEHGECKLALMEVDNIGRLDSKLKKSLLIVSVRRIRWNKISLDISSVPSLPSSLCPRHSHGKVGTEEMSTCLTPKTIVDDPVVLNVLNERPISHKGVFSHSHSLSPSSSLGLGLGLGITLSRCWILSLHRRDASETHRALDYSSIPIIDESLSRIGHRLEMCSMKAMIRNQAAMGM